MKHLALDVIALLNLAVLGLCGSITNTCVPNGATTAEVRALPDLPGSGVVDSFAFVEGIAIILVDGKAYAQDPTTCGWRFLQSVYDPSYYTDTFFLRHGQWFKWWTPEVAIPLSTEFSDNFESGVTVADLLPSDGSRYTSFVLLSPLAPTVPEYNALRDCLVAGTCNFLDNRIDFDPTVAHGGTQSLRFSAVPPSPRSVTSKALVERGLCFFRKGDEAWFSGWYKVEGSLPFSLLDFETSGITNRPGLRITFRQGALSAELKWLDKPRYVQEPGSILPFPLGTWVNVRVHVLFSEDELGGIQIWQDGALVINQRGRTLPTADSVIDFVQVGITATSQDTVLHVDDVHLSATWLP